MASGEELAMSRMVMSEVHKKILVKNHAHLAEHLKINEEFLSALRRDDVLTSNHKNEIEVKETKNAKNNHFLSILPKRTELGYYRFIEALLETGQDELVELIDRTHSLYVKFTKDKAEEDERARVVSLLNDEIVDKVVGLVESRPSLSIVPLSAADAQRTPNDSYPLMNDGLALVIAFGEGAAAVASADVDLLKTLFTGLHFRVVLGRTASSEELLALLRKDAGSIPTQSNSVDALVVYLVCSAGSCPPFREKISSCFDGDSCPGLIGKPRLFFIQTDLPERGGARSATGVNAGAEGGARATEGGPGDTGSDCTDGRPAAAAASREGGDSSQVKHPKADQFVVKLNGHGERVNGVSVVTSALAHSIASYAHQSNIDEMCLQMGHVVKKYRQKHGLSGSALVPIFIDYKTTNTNFYFRP